MVKAQGNRVRRPLNCLTPIERRRLRLWVGGQSLAAIARVEQVKWQTVQSCINRATHKLRKHLKITTKNGVRAIDYIGG